MSCLKKIRFTIGTIKAVETFPRARNPSYKVTVDFGSPIGTLTSSAQLPRSYPDAASLINRAILAVTNFPEKRIASLNSQFLLVAFLDSTGRARIPEFRAVDAREVLLQRDGRSTLLHGWHADMCSELIEWQTFENAKITCAKIVEARLLDDSRVALGLDLGNGSVASATTDLPLFNACEMVGKLVGTHALYSQEAEIVLCAGTNDGVSCVPIGVDEVDLVTGSLLY